MRNIILEKIELVVKYANCIENVMIQILEEEEQIILNLFQNNKTIAFQNEFIFTALQDLRLYLEKQGRILQCNGADRHVFPSPMQMSFGGHMAYKLELGIPASLRDIYDIFDTDKPDLDCVTVEEQKNYYDEWLLSLGRRN